jgi:N-acyl-D-aspartate/D-glutamate deacylase
LRYFAMGDRARGERATGDDRAAMVAELERALAAGAIGFATSRGPNHVDGFGDPVPSRFADDDELQALVAACAGRTWQVNVEAKFGDDAGALNAEVSRYADWSRRAGARLTWSPFHAESADTVWPDVLAHNHDLNASGITVAPQVSALPVSVLLRFDEPSFVARLGGWEPPRASTSGSSPRHHPHPTSWGSASPKPPTAGAAGPSTCSATRSSPTVSPR